MTESGCYDHLFKVLLIGEPGVGKTSLLRRYVDGTFAEDGDDEGADEGGTDGTAGTDHKSKFIEVDGDVVKLNIWDVSGPRSFKGIAAACLRGAQGFLLVYDATRECSFQALKRHWLKELDRRFDGSVRRMLVANKCDGRREEAGEEGVVAEFASARKLADKRGIPLVRASAKTGDNVREVFARMAAEMKEEAEKVREGYESIGTLLDGMHAWERAEDVCDGTPEGGAVLSGVPEGGAIDNVTPAGAKKGALSSVLANFFRL